MLCLKAGNRIHCPNSKKWLSCWHHFENEELWDSLNKKRRSRLLSSPESPVDLPVTDPDVSPLAPSPPLRRPSSCLGTSDSGSCEHVWVKTAGYVKGRGRGREMGRECVRQSMICPHVPKDLQSFPGAVKLCEIPCATCCSWASIRGCCSRLHLCFGGGFMM